MKTRLSVVGTIVLVIIFIMLTAGKIKGPSNSNAEQAPESGTAASEEVLIPQGAQPIPSATEETKLTDNLLAIFSDSACAPRLAVETALFGDQTRIGAVLASRALHFVKRRGI